ncbi:hypothetical protein MBLNU457_5869t1 [Dothideomycetes sp. NU457]
MTAQFKVQQLESLKNKVIVLTGGALGIGSEIVRICHKHGAHVFFGDVLAEKGNALQEELSKSSSEGQHIRFVQTDAADYQSNLNLFETAYKACGRVDHAVSAAGVSERGNITDPSLTLDSVKEEPHQAMSVLNIDLVGPIYFSRIASVYLRQGESDNTNGHKKVDSEIDRSDATQSPWLAPKPTTKSLTLVSSVAGFTEAPGLAVYSTAKHGVIGLMRSLRMTLIEGPAGGIRTNAICPWMTKTRLVTGVEGAWAEAGLPTNEPEDVAMVIAGVMTDNMLNGASLYVEGGRAWDVEPGIDGLMPEWMGEKRCAEWRRGQVVLGSGAAWQNREAGS